MAAVIDGTEHPLDEVLPATHVFAGPVPRADAYILRARAADGAVWEGDDPYRFGPVIGEMDEYLLGEGTHRRIWQVLGAHVMHHEGAEGTHFAVWAPNARRVSVVGDSTAGTDAATRCGPGAPAGYGRSSCPAWARGRSTNTNWSAPMARCCR